MNMEKRPLFELIRRCLELLENGKKPKSIVKKGIKEE
jgi:hypothetical protein